MNPQFERLVLDPFDPLTQQAVDLIHTDLFGMPTPKSWQQAVVSLAGFDTSHYVLTDTDDGNRLVAVGSLMPSESIRDELYVNELVVVPDMRGRKLGRMMLGNLESVARNTFDSPALALCPTASSRGFYIRQGYVQHPIVPTELTKRLVRVRPGGRS